MKSERCLVVATVDVYDYMLSVHIILDKLQNHNEMYYSIYDVHCTVVEMRREIISARVG